MQQPYRMQTAIRLCMGDLTSEAEKPGLPASLCEGKFLNSFAAFHFASIDISSGVYSNPVNEMDVEP
jgi:hypothetical protein